MEFRGTLGTQIYSHDGEWHYLEITTSPNNDLRKRCDVARSGADLRKNRWRRYFPAIYVAFAYKNKSLFAYTKTKTKAANNRP